MEGASGHFFPTEEPSLVLFDYAAAVFDGTNVNVSPAFFPSSSSSPFPLWVAPPPHHTKAGQLLRRTPTSRDYGNHHTL